MVPCGFPNRVWLVFHPDAPLPFPGPMPTLQVNGKSVEMIPRIDFRKTISKGTGTGDVVLFHADITDVVQFRGDNTVLLRGVTNSPEGRCYVTAAVNQDNAQE